MATGEGFHDFRCWLVGRGRHADEAALKHPDTLADVLDGDHDQDDAQHEPIASSTSDATARDAGGGAAACRRPAPSCPCW